METTQPQPEGPEAARESIASLKADSGWMKSYLEGDSGKVAEMAKLHAAAFPDGSEQAAAPKAAPAPAQAEPGDASQDVLPYEPPSGPWEYDFSIYGSDAPDDHLAYENRFKEALAKAEVPVPAVHFAQSVIQRNVRDGIAWNHEAIASRRASCEAELARRYGDGAKQIIAEASRAFGRLDDVSLDIGDMIANTGAGVDPDFIETLARLERGYYAKRGK